jgi:hypothetical protein
MFDEIAQLPHAAVNILVCQAQSEVRWRSWYELYLHLEKLIWDAGSALSMLERGPEANPHTEDPLGRYVYLCNNSFGAVDQDLTDLFRLLFGMMRHIRAKPGPGELQALMIHDHCHPKSHWLMTWDELCYVGRASKDGANLERQVLRVLPAPDHRLTHVDIEKAELILSVATDISTPSKRAQAAQEGQKSLIGLIESRTRLKQVMRERCRIDDLLDLVDEP